MTYGRGGRDAAADVSYDTNREDSLLDLDETAAFFRVSPETVKYLRAQGRFAPAIKIGRRVMWLRGDLVAWRNGQREAA